MILSLIFAAATHKQNLANWYVVNSGNCLFNGSTVTVPVGSSYQLNGNQSITVPPNVKPSNIVVYVPCTAGNSTVWEQVTIYMVNPTTGVTNWTVTDAQLNTMVNGGPEVAFHTGGVFVVDNSGPPPGYSLAGKPNINTLGNGLSKFRVHRLRGSGSTTFAGNGASSFSVLYMPTSYDYLAPDDDTFDVVLTTGTILVAFNSDANVPQSFLLPTNFETNPSNSFVSTDDEGATPVPADATPNATVNNSRRLYHEYHHRHDWDY